MLLGGPHGGNKRSDVQDDPAFRTLRGIVNCRTTLLAGFTTARNLGLFVKTGGYLLDVALGRAIDNGWIDGPRLVPAGHAITPTGGHLDPTMFQRFGPDIMPLSVEEGIANGVPEVRKAVRYQLKYGAARHQDLRVGRRDVAQRRSGRAAVLRRRARRDRRRGASRGHQGRGARARRRRHPGVHPRRRRLHRARIARERRDHSDDGRATARSSCRRATCPRGSTSHAPRPSSKPRRRRCSPVRARCWARRSRRASRSRAAPTRPRSRTARTPRSCGRWSTAA